MSIAVVRHLATVLLYNATGEFIDAVATMTDDEFWTLLRSNPRTSDAAIGLRRDPAGWTISDVDDPEGIDFAVTRLYLDLPLVDGQVLVPGRRFADELPTVPWKGTVIPPAHIAATKIGIARRPLSDP